MPARTPIQAIAAAGSFGISFSAVFVRLASVSPSTAALFRAAYALLPLLILDRVRPRHRSTRLRMIAFASGLLLALDLALWHRSIAWIGAGLATVVANTQVLFVGAVAWWLHRERPAARALLTVPFVLLGVLLTTGLGRPDAYGARPIAGAILAVCAAAAYSGFLLVFRQANRDGDPVGPLLDSTLGTAVGSIATGLFDPGFSLLPSWPQHGWLLLLALGSQVAGWLAIAVALPRLAALETSVLLLLQPLLTMLWGLLIFDEALSRIQWAGVPLVLGGVAWLSWRGSVLPRAPAPPEP